MKITIETEFNPGDVVCRKNLVTNEAEQTKIERVTFYAFIDKDKTSYAITYSDGTAALMCNIPGEVGPNNAFATKEDADSCPAYRPNNNENE